MCTRRPSLRARNRLRNKLSNSSDRSNFTDLGSYSRAALARQSECLFAEKFANLAFTRDFFCYPQDLWITLLVTLCGRPQMPIGRAVCHFALNLGILKKPI